MNLSEFTGFVPGPWKARTDPAHYDTLSTVVGGESSKVRWPEHELRIEVGGWGDIPQQEATTRLIAAAPELLEYARGLEAELRRRHDSPA